jgi:hypothetical protein
VRPAVEFRNTSGASSLKTRMSPLCWAGPESLEVTSLAHAPRAARRPKQGTVKATRFIATPIWAVAGCQSDATPDRTVPSHRRAELQKNRSPR